MTHQAHLKAADASTGWLIGQAVGKGRNLGARFAAIFRACADAWEAASLYEDLSRLSDAELERRGIPRTDLHRCVFEALAGLHLMPRRLRSRRRWLTGGAL